MKKNDFLYLSDKIDKVDESLDTMAIILARQEENLKEHMRRTELNEQALDIQKKEHEQLKELVISAKAVGKFISWVVGLSSFILTLLQILAFFKS